MAEESGKLSRISDDDNSDAVSTAAGADADTYLATRVGDYPADNSDETLDASDAASDDAATDEDADADTEQIRAQIEQTRSQMSETIDAIQEKLSMSNIKEQVSEQITSAVESAKDAVYDATIGKAESLLQTVGRSIGGMTGSVSRSLGDVGGSVTDAFADTGIVETVRRNPLPFALIGLGVGMLVLNSRRETSTSSKSSTKYLPSYSYDYDAGNYTEGDDYYSGREGNGKSRTGSRSTLKSASKTVGSAASTAYEGVSSAANSAYQGLTSAAGSAYESVGTVGTQARQIADKAQDHYEYYLEENPLAVGAVALAVGAAVGLMIPSTQTESRLVGEYRDDLVQKAGDMARGALDKVQQMAGDVARNVQDQTQNQDVIQ